MRICLFARRRCRRNRLLIVSVLLLVYGLYVLGYQRGSLSWDKEEESPFTQAQHGDVPADDWLQFEELDNDDSVFDPANETLSHVSLEDVTVDGDDPGLQTTTPAVLHDDNTERSKTNITRTSPSPRLPAKGTNRYSTPLRLRIPTPSGRRVSHTSQTSLSTRSVNDGFRITPKVRLPVTYSHKSYEITRNKPSEKNEVSKVTKKAPKIKRSRANKKNPEGMLINTPSKRSNTSNCSPDFLDDNIAWRYGKCVPHRVSPVSCQIVKQFYQLDPSLTTCRNDLQRVICNVSVIDPAAFTLSVRCNRSMCAEHTKPDSILVLSLQPKDGFIKVNRKFQTVEQLEQNLPEVIRMNIKKKLFFVFLQCLLKGTKNKVSQLVPVDPALTVRRARSRDANQINVNILLLDSVSRAHFYRSLPKTIQLFKSWKNHPKDSPAKVFDFELFQALEGHTAENTHALFNGKLLPPDPTKRSDRRPVNPGNMFGRFSTAGYQTMWQEDLCWTGGWGLMVDLGAQRWRELTENVHKHSIDHTGKISA